MSGLVGKEFNLMEQDRKIALVAGTIGLGIISGFIILIARNSNSIAYYWGLLIGIVFGIGMCVYLAEAWDPNALQPTNPTTSRASWNLLWVIPLGVFAANILSDVVGEVVGALLLGCIFSWLEVTMIYFVFQLWWHRPR